MLWLTGATAALAAGLASARPQSDEWNARFSSSPQATLAGMMATFSETENYRFLNFVVNEYNDGVLTGQLYCSKMILNVNKIGDELDAECTEKDIDADFIEGDITFDDFDAITESKKGSSPVARLYYRLTSFDWILQFNMAFRLPDAPNGQEAWSENINVVEDDWKCGEVDGYHKCLWDPEDQDKRIIRGL